MYPNLKAEMARADINQQALAQMTGKTVGLICAKLNGKSEISLDLAKKIKTAIGTTLPLEVLFERKE